MLRSRRRRIIISLLTIITLLVSGMVTTTYAANSKVTISGNNSPSALTAGKSYSVKGTIKSNIKIKRVEIGIANSKGKWTSYKYDNKKVNAKSFSIKKADSKLKFSKLKAGTYYYRIYAHTSDGKVHTVLNKKFTVTNGATASNIRYPSSLEKGKGFDIKGTIKSTAKINTVTVGAVNSNGSWTSVKYTKKNIKAKSFDLSKINSNVKFGTLAAGTYTYRIDVTTTSGTQNVFVHSFVVTAPATATSSSVQGALVAPATGNVDPKPMTEDTTSAKASSGSDKVKLVNVKYPSTYNVGSAFTPSGTIQSTEMIRRVEIGIVFAPTNKWTAYKYDNSKVNSTSFDLKNAASSLSFNKLPGGTFKYRIYVHLDSGVVVALNQPFTVKPSSKPQAAVSWAIKIANDNSFSYGQKPQTSRVGCYFCGTNQKNKPKGYEKTYVCLTYIGAAYAHGAQDPEILKACKNGKMTIYETNHNFTKFSCWMKLGSCKELTVADLQPGDVIIKWSDNNDGNGHVIMYIGGDSFVEAISSASGGCWGANSIASKTGMASRLKSLSSNSKNYVMRYIH